MQVIRSYALFCLLLVTFIQCTRVNAQRIYRRQGKGQQMYVEETKKEFDEAKKLKLRNMLTKQLLELEDLEITTEHNLLDDDDDEYEYRMQQQQKQKEEDQELYEYELQQEKLRQQKQLEQQEYEYELQQRELAVEKEEKQKQQQQQQHKYNLNRDTYMEDDGANFQYNPVENNFYEHYNDGTYAFGYALPNGVRRFERSYYTDDFDGMLVEGFYTEVRDWGTHKNYELHCYRSGPYGYRPMRVQILNQAPMVRRNTTLDVNCFDN